MISVYIETERLSRDKQGEGDRGKLVSSQRTLNRLRAREQSRNKKKGFKEVEDEDTWARGAAWDAING